MKKNLSRLIFFSLTWLLVGTGAPVVASAQSAAPQAMTEPDERLLATAYSHAETLRYTVSWMRLVAGELEIQVQPASDRPDRFLIEVTARTAGLFGALYPVEDRFRIVVEGSRRLPLNYRFEQQEGSRRNLRITEYDQRNFVVTYRKNEEPPEVFALDGPVHNEFTSFLAMRAMPLRQEGPPAVVPTFADKKRHLVPVVVEEIETRATIFGDRRTLRVQPRLQFKGLYDKAAPPLIWLTDDDYRLPVWIKAKILIGSLTAILTEYEGPAGRASLD